jgi:short-subunit dehydrogenase
MQYALITGATSGIGLELAKIMAGKGHHLILVARRLNLLQDLKIAFEEKYGVKVEIRCSDLSIAGETKALYEFCKSRELQVEYLINNAGYGDYGKIDSSKLQIYQNMLQLNVVALTELTALFVNDMKQRKSGRILNVGSIAAFQPGPNLAVYAASKAYVMHFTEALNYELRDTGVTATVLNPGVTETGFFSRAHMESAANVQGGSLMNPASVAMTGYRAMMAGKLNVVPGWKNRMIALGSMTMPSREALLRITGAILKDTAANK